MVKEPKFNLWRGIERIPVRKAFLGDCMGVVLYANPNGHILFQVVVYDDGLWHGRPSGASSGWAEELAEQLALAIAYIQTQKKDLFGYRFKR